MPDEDKTTEENEDKGGEDFLDQLNKETNSDKEEKEDKEDKEEEKDPLDELNKEKKEEKEDKEEKSPSDSEKEDKEDKEFNLKVPEGVDKVNESMLKAFQEYAIENKLTVEEAQSMVDFYAKYVKEEDSVADKEWQEQNRQWAEEVRKDKEFGGKNLSATVADARRAIDVFGDEDVRAMLREAGMLNQLPMVKMLAKIGKASADEKVDFGKSVGTSKGKSAEQIMFPTMFNEDGTPKK